MISLTKNNDVIKFTFSNNQSYLKNGTIEVPVNSLSLVVDDSDMVNFKKSASNDIFISAPISEFGMTKNELISWYKDNIAEKPGKKSEDTLKKVIDRTITSIEIPSGVTTIGSNAFRNCENLQSIDIPSGVTTIGNNAFAYCNDLNGVALPSSVTSIGNSAFEACTGLTSIEIPSGVTKINATTFSMCMALTSVTIPNSVTNIDRNAFMYCTSLSSITIPNTVTSIGQGVFQDCSNLKTANIPSGITKIDGLFQGCSKLESIDIPVSVTDLGNSTFRNCSSLTSVEVPSGVKAIGGYVFNGCTGLTGITIYATTPPTLNNANSFANTNDCPVYVPSGSVNTFKTANKWSSIASRIQAIPVENNE